VLKTKTIPIESVYVPVKRRATLDPSKVRSLAESILNKGQETPILVRPDGDRFVLVEGLHRLEACRSLGEPSILGYLVQSRQH
jgi:ParB-like chromosome segregation protein Spo0J